MNCEKFNDRLPEYLDESLSGAEQADAREHVQKCGACRQAVERQEAFAKSIRLSFHREIQGLALSAETRRIALNLLKQEERRPTLAGGIRKFYAALLRRPAWAGVFALCLALLVSAGHFLRQAAMKPDLRADAQEAVNTYVVDVPIQTDVHIFRKQNNTVVDAVVTGLGVISASFSENAGPSAALKPNVYQN